MRLLVEGWRGISHSYAMVNQYQLLELARRPDMALATCDLPFFNADWSAEANPAGFDAARTQALADIPPPDGAADVVYRIAYPYRAGAHAGARVFCQATCEYRRMVDAAPFVDPPDAATQFITPSHWARAGLMASGITNPIHVVPHGVDTQIFTPDAARLRPAMRARYNIAPDRFVFLNVSLMSFNKGIDLLLVAFNEVRRRHPHALLLLKDQRGLYGWNGGAAIAQARQMWPGRLDDLGREHIGVIGAGLSLKEMAALYACADGYVSPYRAEGFNIPPLEAAACGLPVAVTAGGATDDYAHDSFALRLPSRDNSHDNMEYLEPELDALIEAMTMMIEHRLPAAIDPARARAHIAAHLTWTQTVDKLLAAFAN